MTITISPKTEILLKEQAARAGQDTNSLADKLLTELLEAEANDFEETCAGIEEGLADAEAGRVTSLEQVVAEVQERRRKRAEMNTTV